MVNGLTLSISCEKPEYNWGDSTDIHMTLTNHEKAPVTVPAMRVEYARRGPAHEPVHPRDPLSHCREVTFVFRFQNGSLIEVPNFVINNSVPYYDPLKIEGSASLQCSVALGNLLWFNGAALQAVTECKEFRLTAIVKDLGLKSNSLDFNGYKPPQEKLDPLEDAATYRRLRDDWQKREHERSGALDRRIHELLKRGEDPSKARMKALEEIEKVYGKPKPRPGG